MPGGRARRAARDLPVGPARQARGPPPRVDVDLGRLQQPVHLLHRAVAARARTVPHARRRRRRGAGAGRRRRGRGDPARPERQQLRPRPPTARRPRRSGSPSCCAPSARSTGSNGSASPRRTRATSPRTSSRRWPRRPTVCEHLHLPLQSGSDRVLRAMRRSYRSRRYLELVERTRELMPDAALTTDIIVGFPGETDEDFEQTLEVVAASRFDQAFTFQYSPRPGTPAAEMVDQFVDPDVVGRALPAARGADPPALAGGARAPGRPRARAAGRVGQSKTDASRLSARTRGNHLVHLPAPSERAPTPPGTWSLRRSSRPRPTTPSPTPRPTSGARRRGGPRRPRWRAGQDVGAAVRPSGLTAPVGAATVSATRRALPLV